MFLYPDLLFRGHASERIFHIGLLLPRHDTFSGCPGSSDFQYRNQYRVQSGLSQAVSLQGLTPVHPSSRGRLALSFQNHKDSVAPDRN